MDFILSIPDLYAQIQGYFALVYVLYTNITVAQKKQKQWSKHIYVLIFSSLSGEWKVEWYSLD